jgi:hypothetical protein
VSGVEVAAASCDSLIDLATELGRACLEEQRLLEASLRSDAVYEAVERLAALVAATDSAAWQMPHPDFSELIAGEQIAGVLAGVASLDPVGQLGVLRGLCVGALQPFFDDFEGHLTLSKGMPLPHATRPVQKLFGSRCTPYQGTISVRELLGRTGFDLFRDTDPSIAVTLDYSRRDEIDAIGWPEERLPRVGSLHPRLDGERLSYTLEDGLVFDVRPTDWSLDQTLQALESVSDAEIALLPELCLPAPGVLEEALRAAPQRYSSMVVAGSAHERIGEGESAETVNESRVYIAGERVLTHRKIRPLRTRQIGNRRFDELVCEDLSPQHELTLLSGDRTRMGVVICADINEGSIPGVLERCGVNLLLVPSLTYRTGAFNGAVCQLASHCQALCVVVNPVLDQLDDESHPPFLVLASVPCSGANEQSAEYFAPRPQTTECAQLDPNRPLASDHALSWS